MKHSFIILLVVTFLTLGCSEEDLFPDKEIYIITLITPDTGANKPTFEFVDIIINDRGLAVSYKTKYYRAEGGVAVSMIIRLSHPNYDEIEAAFESQSSHLVRVKIDFRVSAITDVDVLAHINIKKGQNTFYVYRDGKVEQ